jgi:hypothetical protein
MVAPISFHVVGTPNAPAVFWTKMTEPMYVPATIHFPSAEMAIATTLSPAADFNTCGALHVEPLRVNKYVLSAPATR